MKKLMIAAAIVCAAVVANAASFDWKTSATGKIYNPGQTTTTLASGTAYIFDSASVSQLAVLQQFYSDGTLAKGSLDNKTVTSGAITQTAGEAFSWGKAGDTLSSYIALIDGKNIYISSIVDTKAPEISYAQIAFNCKNTSQAAVTTLTKSPESFGGAGWYTVGTEPEPTPEPTSALLMLLGVAGLALKRKRA